MTVYKSTDSFFVKLNLRVVRSNLAGPFFVTLLFVILLFRDFFLFIAYVRFYLCNNSRQYLQKNQQQSVSLTVPLLL